MVTTVGNQEVAVVLNGLGVVVIGPESVVDDDALPTVNFPRWQGDAMTIVGTLDSKQVVVLGSQTGLPPTTFDDCLGSSQGR